MNKIKCLNCGITNWSNAEQCVKCRQLLGTNAQKNYTYQSQNSSEDKPGFSFGGIAVILLVGVFGIFFVWNSLSKSSQTTAKNDDLDSSQSAESVKEVAIAMPPADFSVVAPDLKNFSDLVRTEIEKNNGSISERSSELSGGSAAGPGSTITSEQMDKAISSRYGNDCSRNIDECKARVGNQVYPVTAAELENSYKYVKETKTTICKPTIQGNPVVVMPGFYHKYDNGIYFVVKVKAKGLEGYFENNECKTRPAMGDLPANIYLKWVNSRWQASNQTELNQASLAFQKKQKETATERLEKERAEKDKARYQSKFNSY